MVAIMIAIFISRNVQIEGNGCWRWPKCNSNIKFQSVSILNKYATMPIIRIDLELFFFFLHYSNKFKMQEQRNFSLYITMIVTQKWDLNRCDMFISKDLEIGLESNNCNCVILSRIQFVIEDGINMDVDWFWNHLSTDSNAYLLWCLSTLQINPEPRNVHNQSDDGNNEKFHL